MIVEPTSFLLCLGSLVIGEVVNAFYSDATGNGLFRPAFGEGDDPTLKRLHAFISFSEEWHSRLKAEQPHDVSEWDIFKDVCESDQWNVVGTNGAIIPIGTPTFVKGEVIWKCGKPG